MKGRLHQNGLRLILDFVPNHTACDHDWVYVHPGYYVSGPTDNEQQCGEGFFRVEQGSRVYCIAHGRDPYFPPWTNTAQLDYTNLDTHEAMWGG